MGRSVWILCADYGCEGLQEPFIAFATKRGAEGAEALMGRFPANQGCRIVEAPLYEVTAADDEQPGDMGDDGDG